MAVTEGNRHQLYRRLEEVLGPEAATTRMEHVLVHIGDLLALAAVLLAALAL